MKTGVFSDTDVLLGMAEAEGGRPGEEGGVPDGGEVG